MWKLVGAIGLIVICAGIDLLWQSRRELVFWTAAFVGTFRALLRHQQPQPLLPAGRASDGRHHAARVFLGAGLAFVVGPILLALGVTLLVLYPNL
ncbi:MAG TPA: hypothetical protein VMB47_10485 [Candidatus Aquilonibacter sp.]|nr:hypothetical protein [Candidatus Aquilonibacter sp.]